MRILICEDQYELLSMLNHALKPYGFCKSSTNLPQAINIIDKHHIDLLVTDLQICGGEGEQIIKRAQLKNKDIFVYVFSGCSIERVKKCERLGVDEYFNKLEMQELVEAVKSLYEKTKSLKEDELEEVLLVENK